MSSRSSTSCGSRPTKSLFRGLAHEIETLNDLQSRISNVEADALTFHSIPQTSNVSDSHKIADFQNISSLCAYPSDFRTYERMNILCEPSFKPAPFSYILSLSF